MSAFGGKAENICSHGAFPVLDPERTFDLNGLLTLAQHVSEMMHVPLFLAISSAGTPRLGAVPPSGVRGLSGPP